MRDAHQNEANLFLHSKRGNINRAPLRSQYLLSYHRNTDSELIHNTKIFLVLIGASNPLKESDMDVWR